MQEPKIEPFIAYFSSTQHVKQVPNEPNTKPHVCVEIPKHKFESYVKFEFGNKGPFKRAKSLWDNHAKWSSSMESMYIISDDGETLLLMYYYLCDSGYPQLLGKLIDDDKFTIKCKEKMIRFIYDFSKSGK